MTPYDNNWSELWGLLLVLTLCALVLFWVAWKDNKTEKGLEASQTDKLIEWWMER